MVWDCLLNRLFLTTHVEFSVCEVSKELLMLNECTPGGNLNVILTIEHLTILEEMSAHEIL